MCVAVVKQVGAAVPSLDTLSACWSHNPDGAGIGYDDNGKFVLHKGFMTWKHFERFYLKLGDLTDRQVFYHFRIATHGSVRPENTHPFPIWTDEEFQAAYEDLKKKNKKRKKEISVEDVQLSLLQTLHGRFDRVMMHNGILPITPKLKDTSDSQELARRLSSFKDLRAALDLLEGFESGSKIAVWNKGSIRLLGEWEELDGVYYSNLYWTNRWCDDFWTTKQEKFLPSISKSKKRIPTVTESDIINTYGVCPTCGVEFEDCNMDSNGAYCAWCDVDWKGNFSNGNHRQ